MTSADPFGVVLWPAAQCIAAHLLVNFFLPLSFLLYFYYGTFATHLRVRITLLFTHFTHAFTLLMYFTTLLLYLCCGLFACTFHFTFHFTYFSIYLCGP